MTDEFVQHARAQKKRQRISKLDVGGQPADALMKYVQIYDSALACCETERVKLSDQLRPKSVCVCVVAR